MPVAAIADTVVTSAASWNTAAIALDDPVNVAVLDADNVVNTPAPLNDVADKAPVFGLNWYLVELVNCVLMLPVVIDENNG